MPDNFSTSLNKFSDAKPITQISWEEFRKLIGNKWVPGMNAPFDPIAAKKAQALGLKVTIMSGANFDNIKNYFDNKDFIGTVVE